MIRRVTAALLAGLTLLLSAPAPAQAHPLGNFTTNQHAGLRITPTGVDVDHILDLAELPAYQARTDEIGPDTPAAHDAYATRTCTALAAATTITVGGTARPVTGRPVGLTFPPGTGGLTTLRLHCSLHADARITAPTTVGYRNAAYATRIGWREVTAVGDRTTLTRSTVPAASPTARLTSYPPEPATSDVRTADLTVTPGGPAAAPITTTAPTRAADRITAWFTDLIGHPRLTVGVGLLALLVALVLGAAHAVAPGHGKTIMAAYLISSRGHLRQALTVAATVAATHTAGVLILGVLLATSLTLAPDAVYDWLRLVSGVLVAAVGAQLLRHAIRRHRIRSAFRRAHSLATGHPHVPHPAPHDHDSRPAGHAHDHAAVRLRATTAIVDHTPVHVPGHHTHDHAHDHAHTHDHDHDHAHAPRDGAETLVHSHGGRTHTHVLPAPDQPLTPRTLLAMGFAGGLAPSPSAVVVLLGAAALGRAWYGVLLVLAFGIGLAATLTGIGFALARWGERLHGFGSGRFRTLILDRLPAVTSVTVLAVGLGMVVLAAASLLGRA